MAKVAALIGLGERSGGAVATQRKNVRAVDTRDERTSEDCGLASPISVSGN